MYLPSHYALILSLSPMFMGLDWHRRHRAAVAEVATCTPHRTPLDRLADGSFGSRKPGPDRPLRKIARVRTDPANYLKSRRVLGGENQGKNDPCRSWYEILENRLV